MGIAGSSGDDGAPAHLDPFPGRTSRGTGPLRQRRLPETDLGSLPVLIAAQDVVKAIAGTGVRDLPFKVSDWP